MTESSKLLQRVVSGGQTGVDRAALDAAIALEIPCGGWCPQGRKAEDGTIPQMYSMQETPTAAYSVRTQWNIRDSDATLILSYGDLQGGTLLTKEIAEELNAPLVIHDLAQDTDPVRVSQWILQHRIERLNVAGPRESHHLGCYSVAYFFLRGVFQAVLDHEITL